VLVDRSVDTHESRWAEPVSWHRTDFGAGPGHEGEECPGSSSSGECWTVAPIEAGRRVVGVASSSSGTDLRFESFDTTPSAHGLAFDRELAAAGVDSIGALAVAGGQLWVADSNRLVGYRSSLLHPWLDERLVTLTRTASGVRAVGAAGAAERPAGATVSVVLSIEGAQATAAVAPDGSFDVELAGVPVDVPLRLHLATDAGASGNRVRRRAP
jgi:hypothetical protein